MIVCALGVLDVFLRAGVSVPGDVSVIGFDNSALAGLAHIDLTSVGQDTAFLGGARGGANLRTPRRRKWTLGQGHSRANHNL